MKSKERTEKRTETRACDLISRQEAIDICNCVIDLWRGQLGEGALLAVRDGISKLPFAQTERKKGEWIEVDDSYNIISGRCSLCGWEAHLYEDDVVGMNYCPNCGADMRGEPNETD